MNRPPTMRAIFMPLDIGFFSPFTLGVTTFWVFGAVAGLVFCMGAGLVTTRLPPTYITAGRAVCAGLAGAGAAALAAASIFGTSTTSVRTDFSAAGDAGTTGFGPRIGITLAALL